MLYGTDLKLAAQIAHPARFQLEDAKSVCFVEQIIGPGIVQLQVFDGHVDAARLLDHFARIPNHRQRFEAEEIHF